MEPPTKMSRPTEKRLPVPDDVVFDILTWLPVKSLVRLDTFPNLGTPPSPTRFSSPHISTLTKRKNHYPLTTITITMVICYIHMYQRIFHLAMNCVRLFTIATTHSPRFLLFKSTFLVSTWLASVMACSALIVLPTMVII